MIQTRNPYVLRLRNTCAIGCAKKTSENAFKSFLCYIIQLNLWLLLFLVNISIHIWSHYNKETPSLSGRIIIVSISSRIRNVLMLRFIFNLRTVVVISFDFLCCPKGKHRVAALSIRPSVRPVPCPANNFKTTCGI